jgi:hypothetical protein
MLRIEVLIVLAISALADIDQHELRLIRSPVATTRVVSLGFLVFIVIDDTDISMEDTLVPNIFWDRVVLAVRLDSVIKPKGFTMAVEPSWIMSIEPLITEAFIEDVKVE